MIFASLNQENGNSKTFPFQRIGWKSLVKVEAYCHRTLVVDLYYQLCCSFSLSKAKMKRLR